MQRPLGVTVIAVLAFFSGLWGLIKGLALLGLGGVAIVALGGTLPVAGAIIGGLAGVIGIIALVNSLFVLGFGYGAWALKSWAWTVGVATQIASIVWTALVVLGPGTLRGHLWGFLVPGVVLYYLKTPEVKRAFGKGGDGRLDG